MTTGIVTSITQDWRGDTLAVDAAAAATELQVADGVDFDEDGGWLVVGDADPIEYTALEDPEDGTPAALTLADPLPDAVEAGLPVVVWDPTVPGGGSRVVEYVAAVQLSEDAGSPDAVIPHQLIPTSGVGNLIGASVRILETDDDEWEVDTVLGREPVVDGSKIDPDTLPPAEPAEPPLPATSPTPVVTDGPNAIIVKFDYVAGLKYQLHVSTVDPGATAPDSTTLVTSDFFPGQWVRNGPLGEPLVLDEPVWVAVVAYTDNQGEADPSPWVEGIPKTIPQEFVELLAGSVIAERVSGERLEGVVLDIAGALYAEPGLMRVYAEYAELQEAIFFDNVERRGLNNVLRGRESLSSGVGNPTATLEAVASYPSTIVKATDGVTTANMSTLDCRGLSAITLSGEPAPHYVTVEAIGSMLAFWFINPATAEAEHSGLVVGAANDFEPAGVVVSTLSLYVLGQELSSGTWRVRRYTVQATPPGAVGTPVTITPGTGWTPSAIATNKRPCISIVDGNIAIAHYQADGDIRYREYSLTGTLGTNTVWDASGESPVNLVAVTKELTVYRAFRQTDDALAFIGGARTATYDMQKPNVNIAGVLHDGTRHQALSITDPGRLRPYSLHDGTARTWTYAWADTDAGGLGLAESAESPDKTVTIPRGAWTKITTPSPDDLGDPDDPNTVYVYADNKRQGGAFTSGELNNGRLYDAFDSGGVAPKAVSQFASRPSSSNGRITSGATTTSGDPHTDLQGNGDWRLTGDNIMSSGPLAAVAPFAGSIELFRVGKEVRAVGNIDRASGSSTSFTDTGIDIPVGFQPAATQTLEGKVFFNAAGATYRFRVTAGGVVEVQMSAANTQNMTMNDSWVTDDD